MKKMPPHRRELPVPTGNQAPAGGMSFPAAALRKILLRPGCPTAPSFNAVTCDEPPNPTGTCFPQWHEAGECHAGEGRGRHHTARGVPEDCVQSPSDSLCAEHTVRPSSGSSFVPLSVLPAQPSRSQTAGKELPCGEECCGCCGRQEGAAQTAASQQVISHCASKKNTDSVRTCFPQILLRGGPHFKIQVPSQPRLEMRQGIPRAGRRKGRTPQSPAGGQTGSNHCPSVTSRQPLLRTANHRRGDDIMSGQGEAEEGG